jgi:hypothetical protein
MAMQLLQLGRGAVGVVIAASLAVAIGVSADNDPTPGSTFIALYGTSAICAVAVAVLSLVIHSRQARPASPQVSFRDPVIPAPQPLRSHPLHGSVPLGDGRVVRVPVVNAQGAGNAEGVHATLRFLTLDRDPIFEHGGQWEDETEREIDLVGNAREHLLDLVVRFSDEAVGPCYV